MVVSVGVSVDEDVDVGVFCLLACFLLGLICFLCLF